MKTENNAAVASKNGLWPPLLVVLFALTAGWPTIWLPLARDHGTAAYIGDLILKGKMPFTDAWEIRTPGIYYIYALAEWCFGKTAEAIRCMDVVYQTLTALGLFFLGRRMISASAGLVAALLYTAVYFFGTDYWNLFNTDSTVALPAIFALWAALPHRRGFRFVWDALCGLLIAAIVMIRITQGLIFLPVIAIVVGETASTWKSRAGRVATIGSSFAFCLGAYLAYLAARGAFNDFYYTLFVFAPQYVSLTQQSSFFAFLKFAAPIHLHFLFQFGLIALPALLAGLAILVRQRSLTGVTLLLWCLGTLGAIDVMAKFYAYHWLPLFAPLALLAASAIVPVFESLAEKKTAWGFLIVAVFLFGSVDFARRFGPGAVERVESAWRMETGELSYAQYLKQFNSADSSIGDNYIAAQYMKERTRPQDPVYIWGFEPQIYYLADRYPPTRFFINYPIIAKWHREDWYQELLRDLKKTPPVYILLASGDAMPWVTGEGFDSKQLLAKFPDLRQFLLDRYQLETTFNSLYVLRLKPPPPAQL